MVQTKLPKYPVNDYDNSLQTNQELRLMRNRSSQLDGKMGEFLEKDILVQVELI